MGQEDEFDRIKRESAKDSVENIAEYFEKHDSMQELVFSKILWDYPYETTKKDYTKMPLGATQSFLRLLNEHFKQKHVLTKEEFYGIVRDMVEFVQNQVP